MLSPVTRKALFALTLAATITTGVATAVDSSAPPSRRTPHASPTLLGCGGAPFRPSALRRRRGYERRKNPAARALKRFLDTSADEVGQPRRGWFLVTHRRGVIDFLAGRGPHFGAMTFQRRRGRWRWIGSGGCTPRAHRNGLVASEWDWDPTAGVPTPSATRIPVLVQADHCSSGRDATGRVLAPYVHYGATAVSASYYVRPPRGVQTCQGSPPTRMTLVLDEPLGSRRLKDLGSYPPVERKGKTRDFLSSVAPAR